MTIILRLQGLDVNAGTEDIRDFFKCLHIPDGGVYIVGGSFKEAFIAFTTETDAKLAMHYTGNSLKGSKVTLHISSMAELEHTLKILLRKKRKTKEPALTKVSINIPQPSPNAIPPPVKPPSSTARPLDPRTAKLSEPLHSHTANVQTSTVNSLDPNTAFLLGICTVLQGLKSSHEKVNKEGPSVDHSKADGTAAVSDVAWTLNQPQDSGPGYVRLFGLPASTTKDDICRFFRGMAVQEVIVNVKLGVNHGCLVKFANTQDSCDALSFNKHSPGLNCVEVRGATEKMWTSAQQECEDAFDDGMREKPYLNPLRESPRKKSTLSLQRKRPSINRSPCKPAKRSRLDCDSANMEYIVMASNLPKKMTKTEIKDLFQCSNIAHKNVLHLLDNERNRTDKAFLIFNDIKDYDYAINLNGCHVGSDAMEVSAVTKEKMRDMMAKSHFRSLNKHTKKSIHTGNSTQVETPRDASKMDPESAAQTCLYVRNLPGDVNKCQVNSLFAKFKPKRGGIVLLQDCNGKGSGEAVVQFQLTASAALAYGLNGKDFMGTQLLLTRINVKQMGDILAQTV